MPETAGERAQFRKQDDADRAAPADGLPPDRLPEERLSVQGRTRARIRPDPGAAAAAGVARRRRQPQSSGEVGGGRPRQERPLAVPVWRKSGPPPGGAEVREAGRVRPRAPAASRVYRARAAPARAATRQSDGLYTTYTRDLIHAPRQLRLRARERQLRHRHPAEPPRDRPRRHRHLPLPRQGRQRAGARAARPPRRAHRPRAEETAGQGPLPVRRRRWRNYLRTCFAKEWEISRQHRDKQTARNRLGGLANQCRQDDAARRAKDQLHAGEIRPSIDIFHRLARRRARSHSTKWRNIGAMGAGWLASDSADFAQRNHDCIRVENGSPSDRSRIARV